MDAALREAVGVAGSMRALARLIGTSHQAIAQWDRVPAERVLDVERATAIPRHRLRPDLYQEGVFAEDSETRLSRDFMAHKEKQRVRESVDAFEAKVEELIAAATKAGEERVRAAATKAEKLRARQSADAVQAKGSQVMRALTEVGNERVRAAEERAELIYQLGAEEGLRAREAGKEHAKALEDERARAAEERAVLIHQLRQLHEVKLEQDRQVWLKLKKHRGGDEEDPLRMVARRTASRAMHSLLARDPDILSDNDATLLERRIATFLQEELRRAQEKGQSSDVIVDDDPEIAARR